MLGVRQMAVSASGKGDLVPQQAGRKYDQTACGLRQGQGHLSPATIPAFGRQSQFIAS
ncbi:Uncharacterised protein [Chlamydia abortus]|nr:Uncharacterised protein [Chlamydia abortus]